MPRYGWVTWQHVPSRDPWVEVAQPNLTPHRETGHVVTRDDGDLHDVL
jgi:hypothetical protein